MQMPVDRSPVAPSLAAALLALVACAAPRSAADAAPVPVDQPTPRVDPDPVVPSLDCGDVVRGAEGLAGPGAVLLVGEMHGTKQMPALIGRIACHAALDAESEVTVGLEIPRSNQSAVDAYLRSDGAQEARASLLASSHFSGEWKDGRSSTAMVAVLESIRGWRASGASIDVLCFDADQGSYTTSMERDAAMASMLAAFHEASADRVLIVLSGNVHTRTRKGTPWDPEFIPMGMSLREVVPTLVALDFRSAGGSMWACMSSEDNEMNCGPAELRGSDRGDEAFVERFEEADDKGFDGIAYLGTATASEPAVR